MPDAFPAYLDRARQALARSAWGVRLAAKLRNQCQMVLGAHVTHKTRSIDPELNGEAWLARLAARDARTFIDVGANVGDWAAMFRAAMPAPGRGLLFEPSQVAIERLRARFEQAADLEVVHAAVASPASPSAMTFFEEPDAGQTSSLVHSGARADAVARTVAVTTIDRAVAERGWERVDFLKVDTEGYDLHVLQGASGLLGDRRIGMIQFEYNHPWRAAGSTLWGAYQLLEASGYQVFLLTGDGLYRLDYRLYEEFYSYSNFVAVAPERLALIEAAVRGGL